jgi:hypothetical protein
VLKRDNGFVLILDLAEVLSFNELESLISGSEHEPVPLPQAANACL